MTFVGHVSDKNNVKIGAKMCSNAMRVKIYVFIFLMLLCCEFSDENLQGPPENRKKQSTSESESDKDEFVASVEDDDENNALKIVPAPDLTKEKERKKGIFCVETALVLNRLWKENWLIMCLCFCVGFQAFHKRFFILF